MSALDGADAEGDDPTGRPDVAALLPAVRRVVRARVTEAGAAEDLVQETLVRVLAAADRVEPTMLEPYAIATARNLVASLWKERDTHRRHQHRALDLVPSEPLDEGLLRAEEREAVAAALTRLSDRERDTLLAHEIAGKGTGPLGDELGISSGAVAAQLNRTRARLRVEYLLALNEAEPPTERCRPVLLALSLGDRRRQREVEAGRHLLECDLCAWLSQPLLQRGQGQIADPGVQIRITRDSDIVAARRQARELAGQLTFSRTDLTLIATAVSEIARNIVRFAGEGQMSFELVSAPRPGLRIVARDAGPGIPDIERALADGYSTYQGLGLGLPGARRLMDEFTLESPRGGGTTVTMTKWQREG